ncbi:hypothetical protein GQ54DRAFT_132634 [Martensiomyces pterosporus]|nr:hypothetical protein GQ54DRAFT_132634 [Martensiomyces pterosporus]
MASSSPKLERCASCPPAKAGKTCIVDWWIHAFMRTAACIAVVGVLQIANVLERRSESMRTPTLNLCEKQPSNASGRLFCCVLWSFVSALPPHFDSSDNEASCAAPQSTSTSYLSGNAQQRLAAYQAPA